MEWTISPWREDPRRAGLVVVAALLLWLLAAWLMAAERFLGSLLGLAALVVLAPGMTPTRCRVDDSGVARRVLFAWDRRAWPAIRRARVNEAGLYVSPFARRHPLDRFRGLFLPVPRRAPGTGLLIETLKRELVRHGL